MPHLGHASRPLCIVRICYNVLFILKSYQNFKTFFIWKYEKNVSILYYFYENQQVYLKSLTLVLAYKELNKDETGPNGFYRACSSEPLCIKLSSGIAIFLSIKSIKEKSGWIIRHVLRYAKLFLILIYNAK